MQFSERPFRCCSLNLTVNPRNAYHRSEGTRIILYRPSLILVLPCRLFTSQARYPVMICGVTGAAGDFPVCFGIDGSQTDFTFRAVPVPMRRELSTHVYAHMHLNALHARLFTCAHMRSKFTKKECVTGKELKPV